MALIDGLLQELEMEAQTTRRVLERVPDDQLAWKPHPKSRTLGELAMHVAVVPARRAARLVTVAGADPRFRGPPSPQNASELVPTLDRDLATAKRTLAGMDDAAMTGRGV